MLASLIFEVLNILLLLNWVFIFMIIIYLVLIGFVLGTVPTI